MSSLDLLAGGELSEPPDMLAEEHNGFALLRGELIHSCSAHVEAEA
ncbi:hypothetical protein QFW80_00055 [Luteimonas sp. M1R5S18]|uniref:Uncharacterized protein n=1 Tax=Luteimonas rhizosphaericola TaxID=3042024 RepID=A0ABT6JFV5_9GAMM|nr:hypothetical protein [Luteimonas rhizosphaericola]MDH5828916.1 hypothetical protein [Luteimonas rhizosphaericola]